MNKDSIMMFLEERMVEATVYEPVQVLMEKDFQEFLAKTSDKSLEENLKSKTSSIASIDESVINGKLSFNHSGVLRSRLSNVINEHTDYIELEKYLMYNCLYAIPDDPIESTVLVWSEENKKDLFELLSDFIDFDLQEFEKRFTDNILTSKGDGGQDAYLAITSNGLPCVDHFPDMVAEWIEEKVVKDYKSFDDTFDEVWDSFMNKNN